MICNHYLHIPDELLRLNVKHSVINHKIIILKISCMLQKLPVRSPLLFSPPFQPNIQLSP